MLQANLGLPNKLQSLSPKVYRSQFRATQMWNDIFSTFKNGMPKKKHMRQLKYYRNSFTAKKAVDFLLDVLRENENVKIKVERVQALKLFEKFIDGGLVEQVHRRTHYSDVKDDQHLYRFTSDSYESPLVGNVTASSDTTSLGSYIRNRTPKKSSIRRNASFHKVNFSERDTALKDNRRRSVSFNAYLERDYPDIEMEKKMSWKELIFKRLKVIINVETLDHIIPVNTNEKWIEHNMTRFNKAGLVSVGPEEDIPQWTFRAMTYLTSWSQESQDDAVPYHGFLNDIFAAITEYFAQKQHESTNHIEDRIDEKTVENLGVNYKMAISTPLINNDIACFIQKLMPLDFTQSPTKTTQILQLCLLFLSPTRRRHLHLLLRFMFKVVSNSHLEEFDVRLTNRTFVLQTFTKHVHQILCDKCTTNAWSILLVEFMMDNYTKIMKIPNDLKREAEKLTLRYGNSEINYVSKGTLSHEHSRLQRSSSTEGLKPILCGTRQKLPSNKLYSRRATLHFGDETCESNLLQNCKRSRAKSSNDCTKLGLENQNSSGFRRKFSRFLSTF